MKKLISVVIPAYNEEEVVDELANRLKKVMQENNNYDFEVIIVENGSWDSTFEKLINLYKEDNRFKIVQLSRNFGCDGGITAGLKYAKGDAAVIMNADLQDPPEMISKYIRKWEEGYEIVYGIIEQREGVPFLRRFFSTTFYKIINRLTNNAIPEGASDFRLVDKKVYFTVNKMEERNKFLRGIIAWTGFKQTGIPFDRPPRFAGESKADFLTVLKVAMNGIFSFSYFPLRVVTALGLVVSVGSFLMSIVEIGLYLKYGRVVPGFTTTILLILFLFGILFFILGIIGEYLARIYDEVKQRPNYIVRNKIGFTD
ncbi:MAG: glycosyltransferase family 2 protein [Candidatus Methanoperedens sp.]|nr:glycosyltransferase family 2 protein [Candidatus Methanoperedens sp.]